MAKNTSPVLEVKNLTKQFKKLEAVRGVSFVVQTGEIVGLLGPNGAGKTTTINMILGLLTPSGGSIRIFNQSLDRHRSAIAARMNFSASYSLLPGNLTVRENLSIFGLLYGVKNLRRRINETLQRFNLEQYAKTKTGWLSSGEHSRLGLAKAMLSEPEFLVLDEPTASIDQATALDLREIIVHDARERGMAVLWTSHNMHEVEKTCDRVLLMSSGRVLLEGDPTRLPKAHGAEDLEQLFIQVTREPLNHTA